MRTRFTLPTLTLMLALAHGACASVEEDLNAMADAAAQAEAAEEAEPRESTEPAEEPPPFGEAELVAVVTGSDGGFRLLAADGTVLEAIPGTQYAEWARWSPDGARLAYRAGDNIQIMEADGSVQELPRGDAPTWSPDGERLAFQNRGDIWVLDTTTGDAECLGPTVEWDGYPAWLPDGRIAFVTRQYAGDAGEAFYERNPLPETPCEGRMSEPGLSSDATLSVLSPATDDVTALPGGDDFLLHLSASPVDSRLTYATSAGIAVLDLDAPESRVVVEREEGLPQYPRFGPRGERVIFINGSSDLFTVDLGTEEVTRLTETEAREVQPDWRE